MQAHQRNLARGFRWLGGAAVIAKAIDFATILVVLLFLTKQQVGVAALVVSSGMIIEALNGLGTGEALLQARSVSRLQLDTLFWFATGAAGLIACLTILAAPWIAACYGAPGIRPYFIAIALKQPLVGAALIPLAIMNRDLQYERIATVNLCATLGAAATRVGLAVSGAGAWAPVAGYAASGLYALIGAFLARPFLPMLRFKLAAILPLLRFGWRAASSNLFEQSFKNVDYLLVGWFYGAVQLATYRVAFDVAMEPAMAVGTLVNRTALPVFARLAASGDEHASSLRWALRRIMTLVAPLVAGLILVAGPLTGLLRDAHGNSYGAAALPLKILAAAALLRIATQLLFPLLMAAGRPGLAARLSAATLILLSGGILAVGLTVGARHGIVAASAVWLGVYPLLLCWGVRVLRRLWQIRAIDLVRPCIAPLVAACAMSAGVEALLMLGAGDHPWMQIGPRVRIGLVLGAVAATVAVLTLREKRPDQAA